MIITVKAVRGGSTLGRVKVDERGKTVEGDAVMSALVTDVTRRVGTEGLDGWTNGYVLLKAS